MFARKVKLVTHFDSNFPMQAHPEYSVQGFQYRENTVSLYPTPSYFPAQYKKQKIYLFRFYSNEVSGSLSKFLMNACYIGRTVLV